MSFKAYVVSPQPNDTWQLTHPEAVRFAGRRGLIARHTQTLVASAAANGCWSTTEQHWLHLLSLDVSGSRWLVFEQLEDHRRRLSRVRAINGAPRGQRTELLFQFTPLDVLPDPLDLVVRVPSGARAWSEGLALDGCAERSEASWMWCDLSLNLGAAVLG